MDETADSEDEQPHPWPHIQSMFDLKNYKENSYIMRCLLCAPKQVDISAYKNSTSNLRKHVAVSYPVGTSTYLPTSFRQDSFCTHHLIFFLVQFNSTSFFLVELCKGYHMYRRPIIIGNISPFRANRTPPLCVGVRFALKGLIFDNVRRRSTHYPAYYTATCQNEKITSHGVFLQCICYQHS